MRAREPVVRWIVRRHRTILPRSAGALPLSAETLVPGRPKLDLPHQSAWITRHISLGPQGIDVSALGPSSLGRLSLPLPQQALLLTGVPSSRSFRLVATRTDAERRSRGSAVKVAHGPVRAGAGTRFPRTPSALLEALLGLSDQPCLLYTSPSPRDQRGSRMPSSA